MIRGTRHRWAIGSAAFFTAFSGSTAAYAAAGTGRSEAVMLYREDLVKVRDMDFGNLIPVGGGTVQINAQTEARTVIGGSVTLAGGTISAGRFDASGVPLRTMTFSINPNNNLTLTRVGGTETMTVTRFRLSLNGGTEQPVGPNFNLGTSGVVVIRMGGRLTVGANQAEGLYEGTFTFTTNYQ
jgi:Domain of unknown function (DUF4402)